MILAENKERGINIFYFCVISDAPADSCHVKRKSTAAADATEDADGASPEKKSRLDEKCAEAENNGDAEKATA